MLRTLDSDPETAALHHAARPSESARLDDFKLRTRRKLNGIHCPDHHQPPRLQFHGATLRDVTVQMSGCCTKLIAMANRAIALQA